jgi:hypothetical protein
MISQPPRRGLGKTLGSVVAVCLLTATACERGASISRAGGHASTMVTNTDPHVANYVQDKAQCSHQDGRKGQPNRAATTKGLRPRNDEGQADSNGGGRDQTPGSEAGQGEAESNGGGRDQTPGSEAGQGEAESNGGGRDQTPGSEAGQGEAESNGAQSPNPTEDRQRQLEPQPTITVPGPKGPRGNHGDLS